MADKGKFAAWGNRAGSAELLPVISRWNTLYGLPVSPKVGDRYIAMGTHSGWTTKRIYTWNGAAWVAQVPAGYNTTFVIQEGIYVIYDATTLWTPLISHTQAGRNAFVVNTPNPRACEWNGIAVRGTIRRGRPAWAKARTVFP